MCIRDRFREQAKSFPPIPDSVTDFVDNYVPIGVEPERWERVASVVRDEVKRAGFQSVAAVVRHCTTFGPVSYTHLFTAVLSLIRLLRA